MGFTAEIVLLLILCCHHKEFPYYQEELDSMTTSVVLIVASAVAIVVINLAYFWKKSKDAINWLIALPDKISEKWEEISQNVNSFLFWCKRVWDGFCDVVSKFCMLFTRGGRQQLWYDFRRWSRQTFG